MTDQNEAGLEQHPPLPPFTRDTAVLKVRVAEDGWNSRDPEKVALAYTTDSCWRHRLEFVNGRDEIVAFLSRKRIKELDIGRQSLPHHDLSIHQSVKSNFIRYRYCQPSIKSGT
jgi:hypothetical protein